MDLAWGAEYDAFRTGVRAFLERSRPLWPGPGASRSDVVRWQKALIGEGLAARTIPKEYGGFGAEPDILKNRIIAEELVAAKAPPPLAGQGISMLVPTLLECGTEEQKRRWIGPTLAGEVVWCQGYSEPGSGSDLASLSTRAREQGDDFVINGQKIWTSTAAQADMIFCLVRTEPQAEKHGGISYLIFSMKTPGIEVRPLRTMTGHAEFNEVFFTDVRVPMSQIVGARGAGWAVANTTLKHERGMLGDPNATEARLSALTELMKQERLDGARLIDDPILRDRLMRLQGEVMAMKFNGLRLLSAAQAGESPGLAGLVVKLQGCELNHQVAALAIDALGELGVLYEGDALVRDGGAWQQRYMFDLGLIIGGGTAQIQKNIIAERGLGLPREPKPAIN
ncbi:MAG TPA: acyl-CoA dehydrogenase family protein [Caulobacteraceae bacterium]|nr:acyl-CoA dehydrogenase family protein [Caulobacteraceae bacterium]